VVTVFVATKENLPGLDDVVKFNAAAGMDGMMFNRFNPGGEGRRHLKRLLPGVGELKDALALLEDYASKFPIGISCSIPMMPCLFDMSLYPHLGYGFCLGGDGDRAYYTFDPLGNVRVCNHSNTILGNILEEPFEAIRGREYVKAFRSKLPPFCRDCPEAARCQAGCRAASEVCCGDLCAEEPFLASVPAAERRKPIKS
jgi:radical SAM protein with 4Fe4S-binding SPASM domain